MDNGMSPEERCTKAVDLAFKYGQIDGDHHKLWVIDQMLRALLGDKYDHTVEWYCEGEDGPDTYTWDVGTPP